MPDYITPEIIEAAVALFCMTVVGGMAVGLLAFALLAGMDDE